MGNTSNKSESKKDNQFEENKPSKQIYPPDYHNNLVKRVESLSLKLENALLNRKDLEAKIKNLEAKIQKDYVKKEDYIFLLNKTKGLSKNIRTLSHRLTDLDAITIESTLNDNLISSDENSIYKTINKENPLSSKDLNLPSKRLTLLEQRRLDKKQQKKKKNEQIINSKKKLTSN